jgi:hypothetical protein
MTSSEREYISGEETDRAWNAMLEGRYADARRLWDDIVRRGKSPWSYSMNRGITRLLLGDLEEALVDFLQWRNRPDRAKLPVPFVGATLWLQGKREAACEDWAGEIARRRAGELTHYDDAGGVEAPMLLWWASGHAGLEPWRRLAMEEIRGRAKTKRWQRSRWPGPLVPFVLGQGSDAALLAAVPDSHPFRTRWLCQAHFYIGASRLITGDEAGYREQVAQAAAQVGESIAEPEYHLARMVMRRLP